MMTLTLITLFSSCMVSYATITGDTSTLRFVHVVWRHGDRSPSDPTFPTDTNNQEWTWPQGWGELTEIGAMQHYQLGAYFRRRYVDTGFLLPWYNASQIYITSSEYNRTIMSALSNLAGMYPSASNQNGIIHLQPIPVHSVPRIHDPLLSMDKPCPKVKSLYFDVVLKSEQARKVEEDYADLLTFLRNITGHPISNLDDVRLISDPLNCERIHNDTHKWPNWVTPQLFAQIEQLHRISKTFYAHDPRLQQFRGGPLLWEIAERSQMKAKHDPNLKPISLKYYAYSAHDNTLLALLENMGAYNGLIPPYASALIFELHEKKPLDFTVQVWYINETGGQKPVRVQVEGCESMGQCSLEEFVKIAGERVPTDYDSACGLESANIAKYNRTAFAAEVLGVLTALLFVLLIISVSQLIGARTK